MVSSSKTIIDIDWIPQVTKRSDAHRRVEATVWLLAPLVMALAVSCLLGPHPLFDDGATFEMQLADAVGSTVSLIGGTLAAWFLLTALLARLARHLLRLGRRPHLLAHLLRFGAPVVRKAILGSATLALVPMGWAPALAVPTDPNQGGTGSDVAASVVPDDVGWAPTPAQERPAPTEIPDAHGEQSHAEDDALHEAPPPPSTAAPEDEATSSWRLGDDVGWGALVRPAIPTGPTGAQEPEQRPRASESAPERRMHVVAAGESLWAIAQAHLGEDASAQRVDAAWRSLYRHNADTIGADPNLIHPGDTLVVPAT